MKKDDLLFVDDIKHVRCTHCGGELAIVSGSVGGYEKKVSFIFTDHIIKRIENKETLYLLDTSLQASKMYGCEKIRILKFSQLYDGYVDVEEGSKGMLIKYSKEYLIEIDRGRHVDLGIQLIDI